MRWLLPGSVAIVTGGTSGLGAAITALLRVLVRHRAALEAATKPPADCDCDHLPPHTIVELTGPHPVRVDATGPQDLRLAMDVSDYDELDLELTRARTVALVGASGGGKSTLAALLPRIRMHDRKLARMLRNAATARAAARSSGRAGPRHGRMAFTFASLSRDRPPRANSTKESLTPQGPADALGCGAPGKDPSGSFHVHGRAT